MQRGTRIAAVAAFLILVFVVVPMAIAAAHRTDLYYTLSSVALSVDRQRRRLAHLLYRPHQHRPGRFRAGRRLCLGDPRHDLRPLVLAQPAARGTVLRRGQRPRRSADPEIARRLFRHGDAGADRSRAALCHSRSRSPTAPRASPASPRPVAISLFGLTIVPAFDTFAERNVAFYFLSVTVMVLCFAALWRLVNSRIGQLFAALQTERGPGLLDGAQRAGAPRPRLCDLVVSRRRRRRDLRRHRPVDLSVELHRHRQRQLHAELLPRRARLRVRPDARHARALFRLGPAVLRPASISS